MNRRQLLTAFAAVPVALMTKHAPQSSEPGKWRKLSFIPAGPNHRMNVTNFTDETWVVDGQVIPPVKR
jgi:hypothetical protein